MKPKQFKKIVDTIDQLKSNHNQIIIAIEGNSSSGKSTLAATLQDIYDCNVFHIDDFFKKREDVISHEHSYGNNIDFKRFNSQVVKPLLGQQDVQYQTFDCDTQELSEVYLTRYHPMTIIEGAFSMHPIINTIYTLKIYLKIGRFRQAMRIGKREGVHKLKEYLMRWIPNENTYFKNLKICKQADVVIKV